MFLEFYTQRHSTAVRRTLLAAATILVASGIPAWASIITFSGEDLGAGPGDPHPLSSAAAASFDAAASLLGSNSIINFESATLGTYTTLTVAPGVSISGATSAGGNQSILNASNFPAAPSLDGFNTTSGGTQFAEMMGGTVTFTFASPTQFFGAYISGIQTIFFTDVITFSDGSSQSISIPGVGTSSSVGALDFVGFTDAGKSITSITINAGIPGNPGAGFDDIGLDDVRYQSTTSSAPEPGSMVLMLGGICIALAYRRHATLVSKMRD
jgi:hypothetical protein